MWQGAFIRRSWPSQPKRARQRSSKVNCETGLPHSASRTPGQYTGRPVCGGVSRHGTSNRWIEKVSYFRQSMTGMAGLICSIKMTRSSSSRIDSFILPDTTPSSSTNFLIAHLQRPDVLSSAGRNTIRGLHYRQRVVLCFTQPWSPQSEPIRSDRERGLSLPRRRLSQPFGEPNRRSDLPDAGQNRVLSTRI